jgi:hypothetical protein
MKTPEAIPVDLGIQVADGENLKLSFDDRQLLVSFDDWKENKTSFRCSNVLSFRWQPIEYFHKDERPDSTYEIINSEWIKAHDDQGMIGSAQIVRHFKLNFNAIGCLEVLCSEIKTEPNQAPETTILTVTDRAPSSTLRASEDRVSP